MGADGLLRSAARALTLIGSAPWALLLAVALVLLLCEALTLVPRLGFLLRYCAAALLSAQLLALLRVAALGEPPSLRILADVIYLPPSSMLVLCACALLPFFIGLCYLALARRADALRYLFGSVLRHAPPAGGHMLAFRLLMHGAAVPFTYVAPAMILKGYIGGNALEQGLLVGLLYWPSLLALLCAALAFEAFAWALPRVMPRKPAAGLSFFLLAGFLLFLYAWTYTLSLRAFGI